MPTANRPHARGKGRMPARRMALPAKARPRRAFTLIETALATIILGTGVLAIVQSQQYFYQQNSWSTHTSTATFLASEVRELLFRRRRVLQT